MTLVRTSTDEVIVCCWDDCRKPGHDEIRVRLQHEDLHWWIYVFCTEFHKALFVNSRAEYGRVQVGSGRGR